VLAEPRNLGFYTGGTYSYHRTVNVKFRLQIPSVNFAKEIFAVGPEISKKHINTTWAEATDVEI